MTRTLLRGAKLGVAMAMFAAAGASASAVARPTTTLAGKPGEDTGPLVTIVEPGSGRTASNVYQEGLLDLPVTGIFGGVAPARWLLEYGPGAGPTGWTGIAASSAPVRSGILGTWHTGSLANGVYTLRLRVWDTMGRRAEASNTVTLANFSVSQSSLELNHAGGGEVTYTSVVPFALTETLVVKDGHGNVMRTLVDGRREEGRYSDSWDGRNDAGGLVADGPYFYVATVTDGTHSMTWDLTNQYLSNYFDSKDSLKIAPFDPFNNRPMTLTYNSLVAGNVTISVLNRSQSSNDCDQPVEKVLCLVTRRYEESGTHTFAWAGVDSTGVYRADNYSLVSVTTVRDRFSRNAVVVYGTKPSLRNVAITPSVFPAGPGGATVTFDVATFQDQPVNVTVGFLNQSSLSTLRTVTLERHAPGHVVIPWDGRANNGVFAAPGLYTITVIARDAIGNQVQGQILATVRR